MLRHPGNAGPTFEPIHASIVQAICRVQATVGKAIAKSARNAQENYSYASADDVYAAVIGRMSDAGLMITSLEVDGPTVVPLAGRERQINHIKVTYQFILATADATWTDQSSRRTVLVPLRGAQSFQAAQSYAEKAFLRSLFKLPTGDMEIDEVIFDEDDKPKKITSASAKRANVWADAQEAVASAEDLSTLAQIDQEWRPKLPPKWADPFSDLIANRNQEILASMS